MSQSTFTPIITYDHIGTGYNTTRRPDPYITDRLYHLLSPKENGRYLDIGCGTGNYLTALAAKGLHLYGIDPSETMLATARTNISSLSPTTPSPTLINATAENIPFPDDFFQGALAVLTLHHWPDKPAGLKGLSRVLAPGATLVFLSFTAQQMRGYWLYHYFPQMIERCAADIPTLPEMSSMLTQSGFHNINTEKYFVTSSLQDHFLYSNKFSPHQYLNAAIRDGASAFRLYCPLSELEEGLTRLKADINCGAISAITQSYQNNLGDYLFITAVKQ